MMRVLQLPLLRIFRKSHIVMGPEQKTGPFSLQPLADRLDLTCGCLLFGNQVIETEHHQRVRVRQDSFVYWKLVPGLVDPLKYSNRMSCDFPYHLLKCKRGAVEQFQSPSNSLQEMHLVPFRSLVRWP